VAGLVVSKLLLALALTASAPAKAARPAERTVASPKADESFKKAKDAAEKLKADPARRKFRHEWEFAAQRFERIANKYEKTERGPEAALAAAELYAGLYKFSSNSDDLAASIKAYESVGTKWPKAKAAAEAELALGKLNKGKKKVALAAAAPVERTEPKERPEPKEAKEKEKPIEKAEKKRDEPSLSDAVADAIRRVGRQAEAPELAAPVASADRAGRRSPQAVPPREASAARDDDEVDEGAVEPAAHEGSVIDSITERLRDVRVGQGVAAGADDAAARARLKKLGKDGKDNEITLAEQLGLKVRRVIIDAGHGGHDTGAIGPTGVQEKVVALSIALKLKAKLERAGLEVLLTRDDDSYLKLEDRTHFANKQRGDLFISVHCNAAPRRSLRGVETYTLNTSSDRYAIRLAARENSSSEKGVGDLQFILADLATKANTEESDRLAAGVQRSLVRSLKAKNPGLKDLGHKEALFFVLLGAKMPAILVETAFLSNPDEEKLLASKDYQDDVATAIADGVQTFLDERAKLARVD
jgi:N-acetylmuramoyl-L-alanine amidase